ARAALRVVRARRGPPRAVACVAPGGRGRGGGPPAVGLGFVHPPQRQCPIRSPLDPVMQVLELALEVRLVVRPHQSIHARRGILLKFVERSSRRSMLMWWKSAVNLCLFLSLATFRMRSNACDTLTRLCARHVLCWSTFPLVSALGSTGSADVASPADCSTAVCPALFAGFAATMTESDFSCPYIIGHGSSPSRCGPSYSGHITRRRRLDTRPPRFRCDPFARDVALDPGRASAPRMAVPHMLPSSE